MDWNVMSLGQQGALQDFRDAHALYYRNKQIDGVTGWADATNMILFEPLSCFKPDCFLQQLPYVPSKANRVNLTDRWMSFSDIMKVS